MTNEGRMTREQVRKNAQMLLSGHADAPERKLLQAVVDEWAHLRGSSGSDSLALEVFAILAWPWEELEAQELEAERLIEALADQ